MDKIFLPVWRTKNQSELQIPSSEMLYQSLQKNGFSKLNYSSEEEFVNQIESLNLEDISNYLFWDETTQYKIYIYKFITNDSKNLIKIFFYQVNKNNKNNKKIIFINPTETCSTPYEILPQIYNSDYLFVESNKWCGIGTFLYAKSMYDGLVAGNWNKALRICNKRFKPFKLSFLVRRGHDRRYEFFKYLHSLNNENFLLTYFNANLIAKGMDNEMDGIEFMKKDGIEFPYCSHESVQPVWFHASFAGESFMLQAISLMAMSKFNLVVESNDYCGGALTEKSLFPFLTKTIPILVNGIEHNDWLEKLGFYTFVNELGIKPKKELEYKNNSDNSNYFKYYFDLIDKINGGEFDDFYENNLDKIEHNYLNALKLQSGDFLN